MNTPKFSIIVPCYNEAENLPTLISAYKKTVTRNDIEIIFVNNGSVDDSENVLKKELVGFPNLRTVKVPVNQGYGFGILSGFKEALGEYMGWTHGDLQCPAEDVMRAIEIIEKTASPQNIYVKGNRKKRPFFDRFFTMGMSIYETLYLRRLLYDIYAQPNLFHRNFYATWINAPHDFSLDVYALYLARVQHLKIIRFPVIFGKRLYGQSHWNISWVSKWKFIKRTLNFSVELKKRLSSNKSTGH